jgi:hypothetical protein
VLVFVWELKDEGVVEGSGNETRLYIVTELLSLSLLWLMLLLLLLSFPLVAMLHITRDIAQSLVSFLRSELRLFTRVLTLRGEL